MKRKVYVSLNLVCQVVSAVILLQSHSKNVISICGVFPDLLKIAIISPVFKTGDTAGISNYCPISVLPCFSKILERVMYNHLYKYLTDQKILHPQQFGFRKGHSTEHAIAQLVDQIYESFKNNNFTVGIFGTVDHTILLKKL